MNGSLIRGGNESGVSTVVELLLVCLLGILYPRVINSCVVGVECLIHVDFVFASLDCFSTVVEAPSLCSVSILYS